MRPGGFDQSVDERIDHGQARLHVEELRGLGHGLVAHQRVEIRPAAPPQYELSVNISASVEPHSESSGSATSSRSATSGWTQVRSSVAASRQADPSYEAFTVFS